jgi:hypothetical protein
MSFVLSVNTSTTSGPENTMVVWLRCDRGGTIYICFVLFSVLSFFFFRFRSLFPSPFFFSVSSAKHKQVVLSIYQKTVFYFFRFRQTPSFLFFRIVVCLSNNPIISPVVDFELLPQFPKQNYLLTALIDIHSSRKQKFFSFVDLYYSYHISF